MNISRSKMNLSGTVNEITFDDELTQHLTYDAVLTGWLLTLLMLVLSTSSYPY